MPPLAARPSVARTLSPSPSLQRRLFSEPSGSEEPGGAGAGGASGGDSKNSVREIRNALVLVTKELSGRIQALEVSVKAGGWVGGAGGGRYATPWSW